MPLDRLSVIFITQQLVGGTGCGAKAAVHAGPQDAVRFLALRRVLDEIGDGGLQGFSPSRVAVQTARIEEPLRVEGML